MIRPLIYVAIGVLVGIVLTVMYACLYVDSKCSEQERRKMQDEYDSGTD